MKGKYNIYIGKRAESFAINENDHSSAPPSLPKRKEVAKV